ncbi:MAG: bifunctional 4-hydroxy-2-oxoglutarate aldolase/2-dehydro-3-deoxy-phosphogluconate aldolase [Clostridia bacterium]|nr:bifunctional 4-hydroxy-2-oxoglutarate aldolase/2-dehydro-3-deoxy-phosphogluconate aldolase [Clostridia bacterium]
MTHDEVLAALKKRKLVAILRGVPMERLDGVVGALLRGGVRILEFTFDHTREDCVAENAAKIRRTAERFGGEVLVGCGTAMSVPEVEAAFDAGACLVISPNVDLAVIRRAKQLGMVSMPGALTPTEIAAAYEMGADIVKLFPAGELGLGYIKAVRGPLAHIPMSAVGGVKPENVGD